MQSLADLQAAFAAALVDPALPAPDDLQREAALSRSRRFNVYRNNMTVSLTGALEAAFPAVQRLVGADFFKAAARAYIRRQPPTSPVLLLYGERLGDFLDRFAPAASVPYLGDVARLEWARLFACHAADAAPLEIGHLATVPESELETVRLRLHPSLQLLGSRFPVASLWAAASGADAAAEVDMKRAEQVAVLRPHLSVDVRVLPPGGYDFMTQLAEGKELGTAAEAVLRNFPEFDLSLHLRGLFQLGAVVAVEPPSSEPQQA